MIRITGIIILALLFILGCDDDDECLVANSIIGYWNVGSIIEDEVIVERRNPEDTIQILFGPNDLMGGRSSNNYLSAHYQLFDNDSIWISSIGGTEAPRTDFGEAFASIMPNVTHLEFIRYNDLVLHTTDRMSRISLNKIE